MAKLGSNLNTPRQKIDEVTEIIQKPEFSVELMPETIEKPVYFIDIKEERVEKPVYIEHVQNHIVKVPVYKVQEEIEVVQKPVFVEEIVEKRVTGYSLVLKRDWVLPIIMGISAIAHIWSIINGF